MTDRIMTCPKCGAEILSWQVRCQNCGELLTKDAVESVSPSVKRGATWLIAFFLCLVYAIVFPFIHVFILGFGRSFGAIEGSGLEFIVIYQVLPILIPFVSVVIAWKWEFISGIVLITEYLFLFIWDAITRQYIAALVFLPFLIPGTLFIVSWYRQQKMGES